MNPIHSQWFKKAQCLFLGHDYQLLPKKFSKVPSWEEVVDTSSWEEVFDTSTALACRRCGEELIIK